MKLADVVQSADWKTEKHSPIIEAPDKIHAGEKVKISISVGKEIPHPNTTEHHIREIRLFFKPDNGKFVYEVASFHFGVHGEAVEGPNKGPVYTEPFGEATVKLSTSGTFIAAAYCNIHGLWENHKKIEIE